MTSRQGQPLSIMDIPADVQQTHLYPNLLPTIMGLFAQTCRQAAQKSRLSRLLQCAAYAAPVSYHQEEKSKLAAIELLKTHPHLLFQKGYMKDPAGHLIYGSTYQIFLGAGDIAALREIHEKIIPQIDNGKAIAQAQYEQQFPYHAAGSVYDNRNIAQIAQLKEDLKEVVAAISEDPCTNCEATQPRTIHAIHKLHTHLAPQEGEVIRSGLHSPPEILQIMHEVYDLHFLPWSGDKLALYVGKVISLGETTAAAVDAQRYKKGLLIYPGENYPPDRTVSYYLPTGVPTGLGNSFFIGVLFGQKHPIASNSWLSNVAQLITYWKNYVGQKNQCLIQLGSDHYTQTRTLSR